MKMRIRLGIICLILCFSIVGCGAQGALNTSEAANQGSDTASRGAADGERAVQNVLSAQVFAQDKTMDGEVIDEDQLWAAVREDVGKKETTLGPYGLWSYQDKAAFYKEVEKEYPFSQIIMSEYSACLPRSDDCSLEAAVKACYQTITDVYSTDPDILQNDFVVGAKISEDHEGDHRWEIKLYRWNYDKDGSSWDIGSYKLVLFFDCMVLAREGICYFVGPYPNDESNLFISGGPPEYLNMEALLPYYEKRGKH